MLTKNRTTTIDAKDLTTYLAALVERHDGFIFRTGDVEAWICSDCHVWAHIPERELDDGGDPDRWTATREGWEELGQLNHVSADTYNVPDDIIDALWRRTSGDDEPAADDPFSFHRCDCCGSTLGGERHPYA